MTEILSLVLLWQSRILPPSDVGSWIDIVLRWTHFVAGITWIGLLYFFNLVNVSAMKAFDAPTKAKYLPNVIAPALWYFRWGALVTVLAGLIYWIKFQTTEPQAPDGEPGQHLVRTVGLWLALVLLTWVINFFLLQAPAVAKNGWIVAVLVTFLVVLMAGASVHWVTAYNGVSTRVVSIGVGGGLGVFMLLNVWGIIWPAQKRILAWTKENAEKGTAVPPESAVLARRAFLASRTNAWLSLPMLFFMAAASHFPLFTGG